ncbi:3-phenylpropionate/cinnamic acid dioxygenase subunit beta [Salibacterium salarium]|uniref:3-phenylpropionate/cinnamic acid dioxygenase subunit beta n=1 Tax=Salibacterium salarium TaxID=284579 RepID=A0A3R9PKZ6_9BACI|nr:3-phenylpropionate/cinnamic acid dioxygenase subunit beta [Salibacterium salarium]RSL33116.1 3-phenylpropionate/cinnamic acid dioxygenase subunit beta [Salibacterium salarium]
MNAQLQYEVEQFYYYEAYLLDHRKYEEWLDLLADDIEYVMPLRVTVDNKEGSNINKNMNYFDEKKPDLELRVERLFTKSAWVDNPATRQRHYITNTVIQPGSKEDEYNVRSYFLYKRSRSSEVETEELFGEREDVLRKTDGRWQVVSRSIYPDQSVLTVKNLAMFL